MRTVASKALTLIAVSILAGCMARAQNSDLGILTGSAGRPSEAVPGSNSRLESPWPWFTQITYAWQLRDLPAGHLYIELPLVLGSNPSGVVANSDVSTPGRNTIFFAPGLRFKIPVRSRLSLYAALGVGIASFGVGDVPANSVVIPSRTSSGVVDFGGGLDFRITRLLSLRMEARDFVTRPGLGGYQGRNHPTFQIGVGFHF
jgi:hypothetical protein